MSIKCDFCGKDTITTESIIFVAGDNGVHICEGCVRIASDRVLAAKKSFNQALAETKEKHADVIDRLANHD